MTLADGARVGGRTALLHQSGRDGYNPRFHAGPCHQRGTTGTPMSHLDEAREIIRQVCAELGVSIVKGVLSRDHVHMFVAVPPQLSISELMRRVKGRSSRKIQQEFPALRKRYWGCHFWARGYFSTTSGNITDDVILQYLEEHIAKPTGVSR